MRLALALATALLASTVALAQAPSPEGSSPTAELTDLCLLYTSDAADDN